METKTAKGFTLIELLIVIGIIGILSSVIIGFFGGATDSAKAAKCMTNMRNLAVAVYNTAMNSEEGAYPAAGSFERYSSDATYVEQRRGWISWLSRNNPYSGKPTSHIASGSWHPHFPITDNASEDDARFALTNGTVWAQCGRNAECYVCPVHVEVARNSKGELKRPAWSYVMNSLFGFDESGSGRTQLDNYKTLNSITSWKNGVKLSADRVLLFAEVPFVATKPSMASIQNDITLTGDSSEFDCTLQYNSENWGGTPETIGFNHKSGRSYMGHVAFADGHVSKLMLPRDMSAGQARELTTWLCQGDEIAFNGKLYERVAKADKDSK